MLIKKCPFCKTKGSDVLIECEFDEPEDVFLAHCECPNCLCDGPLAKGSTRDIAKQKARKLWNKRK